jgi:2-polyprenyl-3-methyl-5-hydroxy-6-metoxy-1,4-benzoquinol methylase
MIEETHSLMMFDTSEELGAWYDQKYTQMGDGWECPTEVANSYLDFAEIPFDEDKILLDVGCGAGHFIETAQRRVTCIGIDLSRVAVDLAYLRCPDSFFMKADVEHYGYGNVKENYDYATSIGSIEHCINIPVAIQGVWNLLKTGGVFYVLVPNEEWKHFDQPQEQTKTDEQWLALFDESSWSLLKQNRTNDISHFLFQKKGSV